MRTVAELIERLQQNHARTRETPLFNPVFQLSLDLSRELEAGEIELDTFEAMIAELECEALQGRARHLRGLVAPVSLAANEERFESALDTEPDAFATFRARWERPQLHCVFTAHPTFLLTPAQSEAVARAASQDGEIDAASCVAPSERAKITLVYEHEQAMRAIAHAAQARDTIVARLLAEAAERWPDDWHKFEPLPFRFATWVGYDMDGRTDIGWHASFDRTLGGRLVRGILRRVYHEVVDCLAAAAETRQ